VKVQKLFGVRMGRDIVFLSISIDSEKDDPEALSDYRRYPANDWTGWHHLTGDFDEIESLRWILGTYDLDPEIDADKKRTRRDCDLRQRQDQLVGSRAGFDRSKGGGRCHHPDRRQPRRAAEVEHCVSRCVLFQQAQGIFQGQFEAGIVFIGEP